MLLVAIVSIVSLATAACSRQQETFGSAAEYAAEGLSAYQRGELDRARRMYDEALELEPDNARTLADRAVIHLQSAETYSDAIADATRAIELDPNLARAYLHRATALVDMGHSEYAHLSVLRGGVGGAGSPWALPPEERVEMAIADATRAIELDPNLPNAYFVRAHANMDIGEGEQAVADFSRVLDGSPELYVRVMTYAHRSQAQRYIGNLAWAIDDATKAMELVPQLADSFDDEARLVTWHGFGPAAIEATAYTNRGLAYDQQGRPDLSVEEYSQALDRDPDYIEAYVNRSDAYRSIGLYKEALEDANKAIEAGRHLAPAYNARALANLGLGDTELALTDATKAIEADATYAMAYSNRAYIYTGQRSYDLAISDATRAIALDASLAAAFANRAEAHLMKGDYPEVISDASDALERDPSLTGTRIGRALAYLNEESYAEALNDAEQVLHRDRGQLYALYVRGVALVELSEGEEGREDLQRVIQAARNPKLIDLAKRALEESDQ